jgi:hypothetical protein
MSVFMLSNLDFFLWFLDLVVSISPLVVELNVIMGVFMLSNLYCLWFLDMVVSISIFPLVVELDIIMGVFMITNFNSFFRFLDMVVSITPCIVELDIMIRIPMFLKLG